MYVMQRDAVSVIRKRTNDTIDNRVVKAPLPRVGGDYEQLHYPETS
jgi:hypothetical protein